ncbi:YihY/virulence factor BrkB family protein [Stappia stellulata]|uniref:YihY/virulence factor BrkB family protein n=1 Tax=Stappia stellulata TaxID=71235 RepID=UPI0003FA7CA6|nr:YihY/virulence factor BrkB family protein [Stappia stellulata]
MPDTLRRNIARLTARRRCRIQQGMTIFRPIRAALSVTWDALAHMSRDDGFVLASHVALSSLLALFPFLIFIAALTGFFGMENMADRIAALLFDAWPEKVAGPISQEIRVVLTEPRGDALTFGIVVALWFASNGVEALRVALNRAYQARETRGYARLRLQSIALIVVGTVILVVFAVLIVLAPLVWTAVVAYAPIVEEFTAQLNLSRYLIATLLTGGGLVAVHALLPAGRRRLGEILPGVVVTLVLWLVSGAAFGAYLASFANYVSTYAGLAGAMTALVFLYLVAICFVFGGELNAAIMRARRSPRATG